MFKDFFSESISITMGKDWKSLLESKGKTMDTDSSDDEQVVVAKTQS